MTSEAPLDLEKSAPPFSGSSAQFNDSPALPDVGRRKAEKGSNDYQIVSWDGDNDPENPLNWPRWKKSAVILSVSLAACAVTLFSSIIVPAYPQIEEAFGISTETAQLSIALYLFGLGVGPMFMSPLSELYGRRPIYLAGFAFFFCFSFGVAFAQNTGTLLVCRFLDALGGSAFLSVAGGSVSDCYRPPDIPYPMAIFTAAVFLGPTLGPVFGSAIVDHQDWRVNFYFQIAFCALCLALLFLLAPETFALPMLKMKARRLREETGDERMRSKGELEALPLVHGIMHSCYTPFAIMLTEPMATLLCLWTALYLSIIYAFFSGFDIIYGAHGLDGVQIGATFWPVGWGVVLGALSTPIWTRLYGKRARQLGGPPPPEEFLRKGIWGGIIAPLSLIWFAFTARPTIHWAVSLVPTIFFGWAYFQIFTATFSYLVAAYRPVAASAMALNTVLRCAAAGAVPLFIIQMYDALTITWASALIAFVALAFAPVPVIFFYYGDRLRKQSKYGV